MSDKAIGKRGEVGVYVPPSRRNQAPPTIQNVEPLTSSAQSLTSSESFHKGRGFTDDSIRYIPPSKRAVNSEEMKMKTEEEFDLYEDTHKCTILLCGFSSSADMTENQKSAVLAPYFNKGALSKWTSPTEVLLVFPSVSATQQAMEMPRASSCQAYMLENIPNKSILSSLIKAAQELHRQIKPERDSSVAQRMITSALGVRTKVKKLDSSKVSNSNGMGAWDD